MRGRQCYSDMCDVLQERVGCVLHSEIRTLHQAIQLALCLCLVSDWSGGEGGEQQRFQITYFSHQRVEGSQEAKKVYANKALTDMM